MLALGILHLVTCFAWIHYAFFKQYFGVNFSAGLGVLSMTVQAVTRMGVNSEAATNNFFLLDKEVGF